MPRACFFYTLDAKPKAGSGCLQQRGSPSGRGGEGCGGRAGTLGDAEDTPFTGALLLLEII